MSVKFTLPNIISASRIVLLPFLFLILHLGYHQFFLIAYILVGSTDFFDGLAARKLNQVSTFGKELDSMADLLFYISSAYFLYRLQPEAIANNNVYLIVFFSLLGFSFILSAILFKRPVMMHTFILRWNAVLVVMAVIFSFWFDTTWFVRTILIIYMAGFTEEILIFIFFGQVDPDTRSILDLLGSKGESA